MAREALLDAAVAHAVEWDLTPTADPIGLHDPMPPAPHALTPWLCCTYLRRCRIDISDLLDGIYARRGRAWAEALAITRLFATLAATWPEVADEAERQWRAWVAQRERAPTSRRPVRLQQLVIRAAPRPHPTGTPAAPRHR